MDDYAASRLGLQNAQLYRYLAVYDWIREFHRPWLARGPKGFITELTDAQALTWIEHRLADPHLSDGLRAAAREGARGAAHAARVPGGAPPGVRGHAAAARGPADAACRAPAPGRHSGAVGEAPCDARRVL